MRNALIAIAIVLFVGAAFSWQDGTFTFDLPLSILNPDDQDSRIIGEIAYDPITEQMYIEVDGLTQVYCDLPQRVFDEFNTTIHKDSFYSQIIDKEFGCLDGDE